MMDFIDSKKIIEELIINNEMVFLYFGSNSCDVCAVMKPNVQELLKDYHIMERNMVRSIDVNEIDKFIGKSRY